MQVEVRPVGAAGWDDVEAVLGPNGAYSGCWCMWFLQTGREFDAHHGDANREALRRVLAERDDFALVAYRDGEPVGWVSAGPRDGFDRLGRSPLLAATHDDPDLAVWSVVCFYVPRRHRGQGLMRALLRGATAHAFERGADVVEGYPRVSGGATDPAAVYVGTVGAFTAEGFEEVARPSQVRRIMRRHASGS